MKQMILINGWELFDNQSDYHTFLEECPRDLFEEKKSWKWWLCDAVSEQLHCIRPSMPCKRNAEYKARKIWFEKYFQHLQDEIILVWHSLWATFIIKYLSENSFPVKINQIHLVCPLLDIEWIKDWERPGKLLWLNDFIIDLTRVSNISDTTKDLYIYHSKDDTVVPFNHSKRLNELLPNAIFEVFETRWHFMQPALPELLDNIWIYTR